MGGGDRLLAPGSKSEANCLELKPVCPTGMEKGILAHWLWGSVLV